jgi:hypothetical protein
MRPEEEKREDRDDAGNQEALLIEEDVIEHDVHDHRAEHGQAERNQAPANEQEQTADDLKRSDSVNVAAAEERPNERASLALHGRHWNEVEERVGPEDGEHEPEQDPGDDDGVFHGCLLLITSVEVNQGQTEATFRCERCALK